jgi:hypothetical protein
MQSSTEGPGREVAVSVPPEIGVLFRSMRRRFMTEHRMARLTVAAKGVSLRV